MVAVAQGEVWWAELPDPAGSAPGFRRPVVVVQGNSLNQSHLVTVVCVPLTSNLTWGAAPGNTVLSTRATGLRQASVANATQLTAIDRAFLIERVSKLPPRQLDEILQGIDVILGR